VQPGCSQGAASDGGFIASLQVVAALRVYRVGQPPYNAKYGGPNFSCAAWWEQLETTENKLLVRLAVTLASVVPSAACTERGFSVMGQIHTKQRNRMSVQTLTDVALIKAWHARNKAKTDPGARSSKRQQLGPAQQQEGQQQQGQQQQAAEVDGEDGEQQEGPAADLSPEDLAGFLQQLHEEQLLEEAGEGMAEPFSYVELLRSAWEGP
jgi:hypothetical protein